MHKRLPLLLALAFAAPVVAGDAPDTQPIESVVTLRVDGNIEIDANGKVMSHQLDTDIPEAIKAIVDKAVATWKFAPPTLGGKPADGARSRMRISLSAKDVEQNGVKGLAMKIDNVTFPAAPGAKREPGDASMRSNNKLKHPGVPAEAVLTFNLRYDQKGKVVDLAPTQCTVLAIDPTTTPEKACAEFERTSVMAIKRWRLDVEPGGRDALATGTLALQFRMMGTKSREAPGEWRPELRTPYRKAPWEAVDAPRVGASDVDGVGGMIPRTAGLTLLEGIGKTL
jgi:hypothetical protein